MASIQSQPQCVNKLIPGGLILHDYMYLLSTKKLLFSEDMRQVDSSHIMLTYQAIGFSDKPLNMKFMLCKMKIFPQNNRSL